ncbi:MAG TPA: hypothetical protein VMZ53_21010 [Kofleriaceae bacterium]|nr:hypothetical protein [Kofleriaceae bacterium]
MADNKNQTREHDEEPNTGMRVGGDGNKIHGDDLEDAIPGSPDGKDRVRRGVETFDAEGEEVSRVGETFDIEGDIKGDMETDVGTGAESNDDLGDGGGGKRMSRGRR